MLRFLFVCLLLLSVVMTLSSFLLYLAVADSPSVKTIASEQLDDAEVVDGLLKQIQTIAYNREQPSNLIITETQLESLQGFLQRADIKVSGDASIVSGGGTVRSTLAFELFSRTRFLNLELAFSEGEGLPIDSLKIGRITLPGWAAVFLVDHGVNLLTKSQSGSVLIDTVKAVNVDDQTLTVALAPLGPLLNELRRVDTGKKSPRDEFVEQNTAFFLRSLEEYERQHGIKPRSLHDYIALVFSLAEQRSSATSAAAINESAILSLAIFTGHYRIGTFVGDVQLDVDKPSTPNHMPTLAGRTDLSQHFIISAALNILSKRGFSLAVGEFKELMDRANGNSGYSFVDLAADRAGVRFAVEATSPDNALTIQRRLATSSAETAYFPDVSELVEGLGKHAFVAQFGNVDSDSYKREVEKIKQRIQALPLYQEAG